MQTEENGLETRNIKGSGQGIDGNDGNQGFGSDPDAFVFEEITGKYREFNQSVNNEKIKKTAEGKNFYELTLKNRGGLATPVLIQWTYADGSVELEKIPAEIWRINEKEVKKVFVKDKQAVKIVIDPERMTADTNTANNTFPRSNEGDRFEQFKKGQD